MNKTEALKAMIDGKKIVDTTKTNLHFYLFENGRFMFEMAGGDKIIANMPEHNKYEIFVVKKTISQVLWITPAAADQVKQMNLGQNLVVSPKKTSRASVQIRISWEEVQS